MKYSHIYKVENKNRYKTSNPFYYLIKTEEETYLFTESDLIVAKERAVKNPEDIPVEEFEKEKKGFFSRFFG